MNQQSTSKHEQTSSSSADDVNDAEWEPLHPDASALSVPPPAAHWTQPPQHPLSSFQHHQPQPSSPLPPPLETPQQRSKRQNHRFQEELSLQQLDTHVRLQQGLLEHPLQLLWTRFIWHFISELWRHVHATSSRLAPLAMIWIGTSLELVVVVSSSLTWWWPYVVWSYPRLVLCCALAGMGYWYLHYPSLHQAVLSLMASSPVEVLMQFNVTPYLRWLVLGSFLLPTGLEMVALHFLSHTVVVSSRVTTNAPGNDSGMLIMTGMMLSTVVVVTGLLTATAWYGCCGCRGRHDHPNILGVHPAVSSPRATTHRCWIVLYLAALICALAQDANRYFFWSRPTVILLAPFLSSMGVWWLWQQQQQADEWLARAVRHALRLTLRDVLQQTSAHIQQDELLQLAMLRWIVDYWANQPAAPTNTTNNNTSVNNSHAASTAASAAAASTPSSSSFLAFSSGNQRRQALQWDDLFTMLDMTTSQLESEVHFFQAESTSSSASAPSNQPPPEPTTIPPRSSGPNQHASMNTNNTVDDLDALEHLRTMLSSMDVDEHAKPAVLAYKRGVEAFPPTTRLAILLSVTRRCPATLLYVGQLLLVSSWSSTATVGSLVSSLLILMPFCALEYLRVCAWALAQCQQLQLLSETDPHHASLWVLLDALEQADAMTILLSGDNNTNSPQQPHEHHHHHHQPAAAPTLLVVWNNICDSVTALEASLTAARCVQTTAVAVDFAANILSLAQFGWEVSQHGWLHGVAVLVKEQMHWHQATPAARRRSYTHAAKSVVPNGQALQRNIHVLQEDDMGHVIRPILAMIPGLIGYGWLWGDDGGGGAGITTQHPNASSSTTSTVVIEELDNDEEGHDVRGGVETLVEDRSSPPAMEQLRAGTTAEASSATTSFPVDAAAVTTDAPNNVSESSEQNVAVTYKSMSDTMKGFAPSGPDQQDLIAEILELLAVCDENGCLDKSDKTKMLRQLSVMNKVNDNNNDDTSSGVEWLVASKNTLQGLLSTFVENSNNTSNPKILKLVQNNAVVEDYVTSTIIAVAQSHSVTENGVDDSHDKGNRSVAVGDIGREEERQEYYMQEKLQALESLVGSASVSPENDVPNVSRNRTMSQLAPLSTSKVIVEDCSSLCSEDGFVALESVSVPAYDKSIAITSPEHQDSSPVETCLDDVGTLELNSSNKCRQLTPMVVTIDTSSLCSDDDFEPLVPISNRAEAPETVGSKHGNKELTDDSFWGSSVTELIQQKPGSSVTLDCKATAESNQEKREREDDENLLVKVGGGLAIFGAVVGGVVLAAAAMQNGEGDRRDRETKRAAELE